MASGDHVYEVVVPRRAPLLLSEIEAFVVEFVAGHWLFGPGGCCGERLSPMGWDGGVQGLW